MREESKEKIKNLECYQNYKPPNNEEINSILLEISKQQEICEKKAKTVGDLAAGEKIAEIMEYKETYDTLL
jgi:hypothetical protein